MYQKPLVIPVTVVTAGTPVRVISSPTSPNRFASSVYFEAHHGNAGNVFLGDANVDSDLYTTCLSAGQGSEWNGDQHLGAGAVRKSLIDLYEVWVDAATNGDVVNMTVAVSGN